MTDEQLLEAAREVLPLLLDLVGDDAPRFKAELRQCLRDAEDGRVKESAERILDLLAGDPRTRAWLRARESRDEYKRAGAAPAPAAAAPPPAPAAAAPAAAAPEARQKYEVVRIHFATDRQASGDTAPKRFFTGERATDERVTYGTCDVSIPADHQKGELESPSWKRLEFWEDPARHVVLLRVDPLPADAFFASAAQAGPQALVFVHGFNVTFEDAARRMAQIARDLRFDGLPLLYSWPSRGGVNAYPVDEATVEWTIPHLRQFLLDVIARTSIQTFHVIAHSMGTRAVARVLHSLALQPGLGVRFNQVILTAPDIDAGVFTQMARELVSAADRVTMYASADDVALAASKRFHGYLRAGDATGRVLVVDGLDSVDATGVDTSFLSHSYFGSVRSVLSDVYYLLRGVPARERSDLEAITGSEGVYFRFVP